MLYCDKRTVEDMSTKEKVENQFKKKVKECSKLLPEVKSERRGSLSKFLFIDLSLAPLSNLQQQEKDGFHEHFDMQGDSLDIGSHRPVLSDSTAVKHLKYHSTHQMEQQQEAADNEAATNLQRAFRGYLYRRKSQTPVTVNHEQLRHAEDLRQLHLQQQLEQGTHAAARLQVERIGFIRNRPALCRWIHFLPSPFHRVARWRSSAINCSQPHTRLMAAVKMPSAEPSPNLKPNSKHK